MPVLRVIRATVASFMPPGCLFQFRPLGVIGATVTFVYVPLFVSGATVCFSATVRCHLYVPLLSAVSTLSLCVFLDTV